MQRTYPAELPSYIQPCLATVLIILCANYKAKAYNIVLFIDIIYTTYKCCTKSVARCVPLLK